MSAPLSLIINIAGPDRPGLVGSLSAAISDAGGNWEGSRMARFAGHFAGVVHVVIPAENRGDIKASLSQLEDENLLISVVESGNENPAAGTELALEVVGQDRTGIVSEISKVLAGLSVNVEELITECSSAPMSGERLFKADAIIELPAELSRETVQTELEKIAHDLAVNIYDPDE